MVILFIGRYIHAHVCMGSFHLKSELCNFPGKEGKGYMVSAVIIVLCKDIPVVRGSKRRGVENRSGEYLENTHGDIGPCRHYR